MDSRHFKSIGRAKAAERLRQMPQDLQLRVMEEGDLRAARNPTAMLQARMNELQNESIAQAGCKYRSHREDAILMFMQAY